MFLTNKIIQYDVIR